MLVKIFTGSMPKIEDERELELEAKAPVESNGVAAKDGMLQRSKAD
ncbi:unnamed protein product [Dibothriocephalus latus]|uniref:Uncharacterized protein n=1 Tax=Dibothriocephalus latus TaxID=60516 RepID=A0A3P7P2W0_DIBLA|nr:unnamed protein product [Dibothriocephalus latus]